MEQDIAQGINVVRHKYSIDPNFKRKPLFLKFGKNAQDQDTAFPLVLTKDMQNLLINPIVRNKPLIKQWKVTKNLPNN